MKAPPWQVQLLGSLELPDDAEPTVGTFVQLRAALDRARSTAATNAPEKRGENDPVKRGHF